MIPHQERRAAGLCLRAAQGGTIRASSAGKASPPRLSRDSDVGETLCSLKRIRGKISTAQCDALELEHKQVRSGGEVHRTC